MIGRRVIHVAMLFVACVFAAATAATDSLEVAAVFCRGKAEYGRFTDVPLGGPIKVEFNQPVVLNPNRPAASFIRLTQVIIRDDGTCQLNDHPINIPWTLSTDKKTLTLYLSEVLRGYLKGGQSYQILIPHSFFITAAKPGGCLSMPFTILFTTRGQIEVAGFNEDSSGIFSLCFSDVVQRDQPKQGEAAVAASDIRLAATLLQIKGPVDVFLSTIQPCPPYLCSTIPADQSGDMSPPEGDSSKEIRVMGPYGMIFVFSEEKLVAQRNFAYWLSSHVPEGSQCTEVIKSAWHLADATYVLEKSPSIYFAAREDFNKVCIDFYEKFTVSVSGNPDLRVFDYERLEEDLGLKRETVVKLAGIIKNMMMSWTGMHLDGMERLPTVSDQEVDINLLEGMLNLPDSPDDTTPEKPSGGGAPGSSFVETSPLWGYSIWNPAYLKLEFPLTLIPLAAGMLCPGDSIRQEVRCHIEQWDDERQSWVETGTHWVNLSDNVVELKHGELSPGGSYRFVLDEEKLYGLDGAVYNNNNKLKIEFVVPDPDAPTYSTGNTDNHVTVVTSTQSSNSLSLVLPSQAGNPLVGNYYSPSTPAAFSIGTIQPITATQATAKSGSYREASVWIVEPASSVKTWPAGKSIHFDVRGRASSNGTIKSVEAYINDKSLAVQRQSSSTFDLWLICDVPTTGISGPVLFKFIISDSNGNFAWAEKILQLNAKPVINDANVTLKGTNLSVNTLITDDKLEKIEVEVKSGTSTKGVYSWKKNSEQTAGTHLAMSSIFPRMSPKGEYRIIFRATDSEGQENATCLEVSPTKPVATYTAPTGNQIAQSLQGVKATASALPITLRSGSGSCFLGQISNPFISIGKALNTIFGLTARTSASGTATLLPSWVLAFTQGLTPPVSTNPTNSPSSPTIKDTIKPSVRILNWAGSCTVPAGVTVPIVAQADDPYIPLSESGIKGVTVEITPLFSTFPSQPALLKWIPNKRMSSVTYETPWVCSAPGDYRLKAYTADYSGNTAESRVMTVHRPKDNNYPSISITSPIDKAKLIDGAVVTVGITASDDVLIHKVALRCRQILPFPGDWVLLQEWERPFPAYRSGNQDEGEFTHNWTCTNYYPVAAIVTYELAAEVLDASGKSALKTIMVTRERDFDAPEVAISTNPSTVNKGENTSVTIIATIKEASLRTVSLHIASASEFITSKLLTVEDGGSGRSVYTYRWIVNTEKWNDGIYTVGVQATDWNKIGDKVVIKEGVATGKIIVKKPVKQQQETSTNDQFIAAFIRWVNSDSQSSSGNSGGETSGGSGDGGDGGSTTSDDGYYYVYYPYGNTSDGNGNDGE